MVLTFEQVGEEWTSGQLAKRFGRSAHKGKPSTSAGLVLVGHEGLASGSSP